MKKNVPWILCVVLGAALIITNLPKRRISNEEMPPDFAQFYKGVHWIQIYKRNDIAIWKIPAYGPRGCHHGETFAVTENGRLVVAFPENDTSPRIYQDGKLVAMLPRNNKMREFYTYGENGEEYRLFDIDADGIIDFRKSENHCWIYSHGEFIEVPVTNSPQGGTLFFLNGKQVRLKNGEWKEIQKEETSPLPSEMKAEE